MSNKTKRIVQNLMAGLGLIGAGMAVPGVSAAEKGTSKSQSESAGKSETGKEKAATPAGSTKKGFNAGPVAGAGILGIGLGAAILGTLDRTVWKSGGPVELDKDSKPLYKNSVVMGILGGRINAGGDEAKTAALQKLANSSLKAAMVCVAQHSTMTKLNNEKTADIALGGEDNNWLDDGKFLKAEHLGLVENNYMLLNAAVEDGEETHWEDAKTIDFGNVELPTDKTTGDNAKKAQNYVMCRMVAGSHDAVMALKGTGLKITWKKCDNNNVELEGELGGKKLKMTVDKTKTSEADAYTFEDVKTA